MCYTCRSLVSIDNIAFNDTCVYNDTFNYCESLEEVRFGSKISNNGLNFQWSTKLTHDSLMSIIDALADKSADTSGTAWTVTIGSTNLAKLTEEEIDIARNKGWAVV